MSRSPALIQPIHSIPYSRVDSYIRKSIAAIKSKKSVTNNSFGDRATKIRECEAVERRGGIITIQDQIREHGQYLE